MKRIFFNFKKLLRGLLLQSIFILNTKYHIQYTVFQKGFTLVELAIAFSIGALLLSGGVVSYRDFNQTQKLKTSGLSVKNNLRVAQSQASTGEKPLGVVCPTLLGYRITFSAQTMESHAECSGGNVGPSTTVTLPNSVTFNPVPSPILFKVLAEGVDQSATIEIAGFSKIYELELSGTGEVQDKELIEKTPVPTPSPTPGPVNQSPWCEIMKCTTQPLSTYCSQIGCGPTSEVNPMCAKLNCHIDYTAACALLNCPTVTPTPTPTPTPSGNLGTPTPLPTITPTLTPTPCVGLGCLFK